MKNNNSYNKFNYFHTQKINGKSANLILKNLKKFLRMKIKEYFCKLTGNL